MTKTQAAYEALTQDLNLKVTKLNTSSLLVQCSVSELRGKLQKDHIVQRFIWFPTDRGDTVLIDPQG